MTDPTSGALEERVARHLAMHDYLVIDQDPEYAATWWSNRIRRFKESYLTYAREVIAMVREGAVQPPVDQALRDRIAAALIRWTYRGEEPDPETGILETVRANAYSRADAVLAVLPAPADRAGILRDFLWRLEQACGDVAAEQLLDQYPELRGLADEQPVQTTPADHPRRGDAFEAWLKARRDATTTWTPWHALDDILDRYRLHADTGTPLDEHVCEGQAVGDCECLEQPAEVQS